MSNIARKSRLARNIERMRKAFPEEFNFSPRTWILPREYYDFQQNFNQNGYSGKTFIIKPDAGCQGRGVYLTRSLDRINTTECQVAQRYIRHPLLLDGKKFDLRIYVLITSCSPLRVYLFNDGLVRLCTADYVAPSSANLEQRFMHLTNYAINKHSEDFVPEDESEAENANKRSIRWFLDWFANAYGEEEKKKLWSQIGDVCLKTIMAIQPTLAQEYHSTFAKFLPARKPQSNQSPQSTPETSTCFEILGFDILVDVKFKPWLIEVNHLPSFKCDTSVDSSVKEKLVAQTFDLLKVSSQDSHLYGEAQSNHARMRLYGRLSNKADQDGEGAEVHRDLRCNPYSKRELAELVSQFYGRLGKQDKLVDVEKIVSKYYVSSLLDQHSSTFTKLGTPS